MLRLLTIWILKPFLWKHAFPLERNALLFSPMIWDVDTWEFCLCGGDRVGLSVTSSLVFQRLFDFRCILHFCPLSEQVLPSVGALGVRGSWFLCPAHSLPAWVSGSPALGPVGARHLFPSCITLMVSLVCRCLFSRLKHLTFIMFVSFQQVLSCVKEQRVLPIHYL